MNIYKTANKHSLFKRVKKDRVIGRKGEYSARCLAQEDIEGMNKYRYLHVTKGWRTRTA